MEGVAPADNMRGIRMRWFGAVAAAVAALLTGGYVVWVVSSLGRLEATFKGGPYFSGWQVDAVAAGILVVCAVGAAAALITALRIRRIVSLREPSRGLLTLTSVVVGCVFAAPLASSASGKALIWASNQTAQAAASRTELTKRVGDATHRPQAVLSAPIPAAPPAIATRLLTPEDLGPTWYYSIRPYLLPLRGSLPSLGAAQHAQEVLDFGHWNGRYWQTDEMVFEDAITFDTERAARRFVRTEPLPRSMSTSAVHRVRIDGREIWLATTPLGAAIARYSDASVAYSVFVGVPEISDAPPANSVLQAAIAKLTASG